MEKAGFYFKLKGKWGLDKTLSVWYDGEEKKTITKKETQDHPCMPPM